MLTRPSHTPLSLMALVLNGLEKDVEFPASIVRVLNNSLYASSGLGNENCAMPDLFHVSVPYLGGC